MIYLKFISVWCIIETRVVVVVVVFPYGKEVFPTLLKETSLFPFKCIDVFVEPIGLYKYGSHF